MHSPAAIPLPPGRGERVLVAMSGGVDSSVAAALLLERGYHVQGLTMLLWRDPLAGEGDAVERAKGVCAQLGIPHHTLDLREVFYRRVVEPFGQEYARGRTPNPCVRCNQQLKFALLLDHARELGGDYLATGHYARIARDAEGYHLLCGLDARKDQSYFLYGLDQERLGRLLLPLGTWRKEQVRAMARRRQLAVVDRSESQDLCFLGGRDYRAWMRERFPEAVRPGPILDRRGRRLGTHQGLPMYTIGQREGLGIAAPRPLYVLALDVARNALIVGHAEELGWDSLLAAEMSYVAGHPPAEGAAVEAKIRYRARRAPARVWPLADGRARIVFAKPLRDITPGQAVVLYRGERVLGGGIIARVPGQDDAHLDLSSLPRPDRPANSYP